MNFIIENWSIISVTLFAILELVLRLTPTDKNYSVLEKIFSFLNKIVPNIRKRNGGSWAKLVLVLIYFSVSFSSVAQINSTVKSLYSTNVTDTAFAQNSRLALQVVNGNTGGLYFDKIRNKFRVWSGSAWVDLISTGGGSVVGAKNGLSILNDSVVLGGTLDHTSAFINLDGDNVLGTSSIGIQGVHSNTRLQIVDDGVEGDLELTGDFSTGNIGTTTLRFYQGNVTFTDTRAIKRGIEYAANYVTGFSARSLVDKTYVDSRYPVGNNTELQFNSSGSPGASSNLKWNGATMFVGETSGVGSIQLGSLATGYTIRYSTGIEMNNPTGGFSLNMGGSTGDLVLNPSSSGGSGDTRIESNPGAGKYVRLINLPTSAAGLPSGAIWNNAGVLNIAP